MKLEGFFDIEIFRDGKLAERIHLKNLLTTVSQTARVQQLLGTYNGGSDALEIKYFAFGDDTTPPAVSDVTLGNELFRKQITTITASGGNVQSIVNLGSAEANFTIREIGVFCGPLATATANSGTLLARVAVNIPKNSNITMNIVRTDVCTLN